MMKHKICLVFLLFFSFLTAEEFYWETPKVLSSNNGHFIKVATNKNIAAVVWEESVKVRNNKFIYFSLAVYSGNTWKTYKRISEPILYTADIPSIVSIAVNNDNTILIVAIKDRNTITILKSSDAGKTIQKKDIKLAINDFLTPQLSISSTGKYFLFLSHAASEKFSLFFASSDDGMNWPKFSKFNFDEKLDRIFLPSHAVAGKNDIVVFQALDIQNEKRLYSLFSSYSSDGGQSWSLPHRITDNGYNNERPDIMYLRDEKKMAVVWEQSVYRSNIKKIAFIRLDSKGKPISGIENIVTHKGSVLNPKINLYKGNPFVSWTEKAEGKSYLCFANLENDRWKYNEVRNMNGSILFANSIIYNDDIQILWQEGYSKQNILQIKPDTFVGKAVLQPVDFDRKTKTGKQKISVKIKLPYDSSGIAGYSYSWSKDVPPDYVENRIMKLSTDLILSHEPEEDGLWYLGIRVCDYAGNWSEVSSVAYEKDTTPPEKPIFDLLAVDDNGFLNSNSFKIIWTPSQFDIEGKVEPSIKGYVYNIYRIDNIWNFKSYIKKANLDKITDDSVQKVLAGKLEKQNKVFRINSKNTEKKFINYDNGLYAFTVAAVDEAGNIGEVAVKYFCLNKYIPFTIITDIQVDQKNDGTINMSIVGKGFKAEGNIEEVYIDRDAKPPYDLVLTKYEFSIINDKMLSDIKIIDIDEGDYQVGLLHKKRGVYFSKKIISIDNLGNVKFGDYSESYRSRWFVLSEKLELFSYLPMVLVILFVILILVLSVIGMVNTLKESVVIKKDIHALFTGGYMVAEKKRKAKSLNLKGRGLRVKFVLFTSSLVISVILILTIPLGSRFFEEQERLLIKSLVSRSEVLLESLSSGARAYLPSKNLLELGLLPAQTSALEEAEYATITGTHIANNQLGYNFIWASNDKNILEKIGKDEVSFGETKLEIKELAFTDKQNAQLNSEAIEKVGGIAKSIKELTDDVVKIALATDRASVEKRNEMQSIISRMEEKLNVELMNLSIKGSGVYPEFKASGISRDNTEYLFYRPILYRQTGDEENFVHGMVYIQVSTKDLLDQIDQASSSLFKLMFFISVVSLLVGILGAYILASIIIAPIKKLVAHVAMISATEDKELLANKNIKIKTKDEIGVLGLTINDMTEGLVKAASASKDLTMGKEIQKMFLPLEVDKTGKKLTCAQTNDESVEFFGYYEGARGVSGDYFDYLKLDDRYYAIIKCDIAGKGIPAALIMVEVATLFLDYFKDWKFKKNGIKIDLLVSRINDLIEARGFKGRFAAFTLCLLDSKTGTAHICNAGDNIVNIYDASTNKMKEVVLSEVSAAGVFPSFMIDMKGGFKLETVKLNSGDTMFLYTDGIEEAKRLFRDSKLNTIVCAEKGLKQDEEHETHSVGQDGEELGKERVVNIIENIFARKAYRLKKWHNPIENEEFDFDFSKLDGSIEDVVIGLVSVEKIFRMYQDPKSTETDIVKVDKKIDLFLNKYFRQYQNYCANRKENTEANEYLYYTNVKEDDQYDDLTILAIKKK